METLTDSKKNLLGNIVVIFYALILLVFSWLNLKLVIEEFPAPAFLAKVENDSMKFIDFSKYYLCGRVAFSHDSREFYSYPNQKKLFDDIILGGKQGNFPPAQAIEFPPYVLPLMFPLSRLPYPQAFQFWNILNWIMLVSGISLLCRLSAPEKPGKAKLIAALITLGAISSPPFLRSFLVGQPTGILFGLFSLYIYFFVKGKDAPAGIFLSLITIKPHYAVFMCIPALIGKRIKLLLVCACCELILLLLAVWASSLEGVLGYIHYVIATDTTAPEAEHLVSHMVNLRGLLSIFLPAQILLLFSLGISFLALMACGWLLYKFKNENQFLLFSILIIACLSLGPHSHMYDCMLLAIPAALTLNTLTQKPLEKLWVLELAFYPIFCTVYLVAMAALRETYYAFLPYSIFNLALLATACALCLEKSKS